MPARAPLAVLFLSGLFVFSLSGCAGEPPPAPAPASVAPSSAAPVQPSPQPSPSALAGDTGRWSDEQRAAVEMTEEFNKVMSAVGGDAASGDYTRLLDVAADPAYSALVTEFIALHASGRTISGPVIPVKRNVGKVTTTADGRIEVVVTECDDVSQIERREADGSIDPGPGTDRLLYTYTLERLDALGWRVVVYEGGSTAC